MIILGVSAYYHDSAAALVRDGNIVVAAQEERFSRRKHDAGFPRQAVEFCLKAANVTLADVDYVAYYDKPFLKFERLLETYLALAPRGFASFRMAIPVWLREKLFLKSLLKDEMRRLDKNFHPSKLLFTEHHLSHAASAFFPSSFEEAAILTLDGVGEWATSSRGHGQGNQLSLTHEMRFPHSLGLLYSAVTYYTGFRVNSGEYKVMGLAPYGEPKYASLMLEKLMDLKPDGSFRLDQSYFDYATGLTMTNERFDALFGGPPRKPDELLTQKHMDIAASVQAVTEEVMLRLSRSLALESGSKNLCLAGGVALNCVANGKILRDAKFSRIWIQPAAGDAGGAIGAALAAFYTVTSTSRTPDPGDSMKGAFLGPEFAHSEVIARLKAAGARFSVVEPAALASQVAGYLAEGKAVGWFQGRMEFGPRALGARSILGDPRSPTMQSILNLKVKFRESFRPFAPAVPRENVSEWFDLDADSPYMLLVAGVGAQHRRAMSEQERSLFGIDKLNVARSSIPAVTHVDYSARVQTVHQETNPRFHDLLTEFGRRTGCPVLVNTSFNVRGEPIVCTPEDAFRCFMGTDIDVLAIGDSILLKDEQQASLRQTYHDSLAQD